MISRDAQGLTDNFAPITMECEAPHLPVFGELPRALNGTLFRNGPNPQFTPLDPLRHHWFTGDGMVHGFTLCDGRVSYRNRWVRTAKWHAEAAAGRSLVSGFGSDSSRAMANEGVANTNVVWHAERLLALEEGHLPIELDPATLATRGVWNCGGALEGPFTAHPKLDPITGELVFFGYSAAGPLSAGMSYGTIGTDGRVKRFEHFEAPYCSMVHDFVVTQRHVVFPVLPLSGSMARARAGAPPFAWEPDLGGYVGLIVREQGIASLRWFRVESCFVFHVLNAWDEDGRIIADVMQYDEPPLFPRADGLPSGDTQAHLVRWTLDPAAATDAITRTRLDDMSGEFPRIDDRRAGLRNRFGAFAGRSRPEVGLDSIAWLDLAADRRAVFTLPAGDSISEPVFVPRDEAAAEGDGWLLGVAWRAAERRSDLIVLDTRDIAHGPIATVALSHRVPFGFHGNWVSDGG
ncbi:carotenoid oxygenase family protein [Rhodopila sp.]|uniref:carotenoid oxygenase family protein n=1 Tax=Rhodopila sp. TaxID=2480087 RepID=UPI003D0DC9B0